MATSALVTNHVATSSVDGEEARYLSIGALARSVPWFAAICVATISGHNAVAQAYKKILTRDNTRVCATPGGNSRNNDR